MKFYMDKNFKILFVVIIILIPIIYFSDYGPADNITTQNFKSGATSSNLSKNSEDKFSHPIVSNNKEQNTPIEKSLSEIVDEWSPRIGQIICSWQSPLAYITGSGFLMEVNNELAILTNKHVIIKDNLVPNLCTVKFYSSGKVVSGNLDNSKEDSRVSSASDGTDWGLFIPYSGFTSDEIKKLAKESFSVCSTNFPGSASVGDNIVVIGYPSIGSQTSVTATKGIISGIDGNYYITDAKIDHGNSGGVAILLKNDCYLGIPSAAVTGQIESLGRILDAKIIFGK